MNANPFTLGHHYLVETAASQCGTLHLFVLSEDASLVPFAVRKKLVQAGVAHIPNVVLHDSGPYIITQGGPRNATTLVSLLVYNYAFKSNEMGMACALAWVMFIAVALLTVIAFTSQKHWVYYAD